MNSLFKETAEEMVNRLFDEWLAKNTFDNNLLLTSPVVRQCTIKELKEYDEIIRKLHKLKRYTDTDMTETEIMFDEIITEQMVKSARENFILKDLTKVFATFLNAALKSLPSKPTHRQTRYKPNHLRLVVNG